LSTAPSNTEDFLALCCTVPDLLTQCFLKAEAEACDFIPTALKLTGKTVDTILPQCQMNFDTDVFMTVEIDDQGFVDGGYPTGFLSVWKGQHRLFPQIFAFNVSFACLGTAYYKVAVSQEADDKLDSASVSCIQFNREIHFPMLNVVETIAHDGETFGIDIAVTERLQPAGTMRHQTQGFQPVLAHIISPLFTDYFENHREWLEERLGSDPYKWPTIWNFARVVRNSASHGGAIRWRNPSALPVQWHHISYGPADDGRRIFGQDLHVADLLLLMLEMDAELDALNCPVSLT
jgi:hypothetical protein